ncbi:unnamed protein product [Boreogadus saida]
MCCTLLVYSQCSPDLHALLAACWALPGEIAAANGCHGCNRVFSESVLCAEGSSSEEPPSSICRAPQPKVSSSGVRLVEKESAAMVEARDLHI